jgi:hypothetical protein
MNPLEELNSLARLFPDERPLFDEVEHVPAALLPDAYRKMLAHDHHMTVTMESYYDCSVDVRVVDQRLDGDLYYRKILLFKSGTAIPVQFGIVRFDFQYVTPQVRHEILEGAIPLGRVLINHNVLRHIDLNALLQFRAGPALADYLQMPRGGVTYGRLATIFCNRRPAVDLLEIPAPLA